MKSLKIFIQSDLHVNSSPLEYQILLDRDKLSRSYPDVIVLAGDIGSPCYKKIANNRHGVIEWIAKNTPIDVPKIFVMGNHEYSHLIFDDMLDNIQSEALEYASYNIHFLHNTHIDIKGVRFLGTPLFGNLALPGITRDDILQAVDKKMKTRYEFDGFCICGESKLCDYHKYIFGRDIDGAATKSRCGKSLQSDWFENQHEISQNFLSENLSKDLLIPKVVVTHWSPSLKGLDPLRSLSALDAYWASDCEHLVRQANLWIHGHVHHFCDYKIGDDPNKGRIIANPRGWRGVDKKDGLGFIEDYILEFAC